jgi:hypothetical protein
VEDPTVQLDDQAVVLVDRVLERATAGRHAWVLPPGDGKAVRPFHPVEVAVLQSRARALRDVGEHSHEPRTPVDARPPGQCVEQPLGC